MTYYLVVFIHKGGLWEEAFESRDEAVEYAKKKRGWVVKAVWMKRFDGWDD